MRIDAALDLMAVLVACEDLALVALPWSVYGPRLVRSNDLPHFG
jgi:hypothetical protein